MLHSTLLSVGSAYAFALYGLRPSLFQARGLGYPSGARTLRSAGEAIRNFIGFANYSALADASWASLVKLLEPDVARIKATINKPDDEADDTTK